MRYVTELRLRFSMLNEHKFRQNFYSLTLLCACSMGTEDNEYFFLHYPQFHLMRRNLVSQLSDIPGLILTIGDKPLCELLLFRDPQLNVISNRKPLKLQYLLLRIRKSFVIQFEQ